MLEALPSWLVSASEATKGKVCVCMSMFACLCFVQGLNPFINFAPANMHTDTHAQTDTFILTRARVCAQLVADGVHHPRCTESAAGC